MTRRMWSLTLATTSLLLTASLEARPIGIDPKREEARCHADVSLCDRVARDDYNRCKGAGQSNCDANYYEDVNSCTSDFNRCMKDIAAKGGAIGGIKLPGNIGNTLKQ